MSTLDDLLTMPADWRHRREAWKKFTTGDSLFRALCEAVQTGTIHKAEELLHPWWRGFVENHKDEQIYCEWEIAKALFTCAKIATLDRTAVAHLSGLLRIFHPNADVPDGIACQAASLNSSENWPSERWQQFVRQWLYKLTYQPRLNAEWAWDTVTTMWRHPRPVACSESLTVLLIVFEDGIIATLTLDRLSDEGNGVFYPDPATMSFVIRDEEFQQAEQNATAYIRETEKLWKNDNKGDVRWKIARLDGRPLTRIEGGSAGSAFALGLAKLFA